MAMSPKSKRISRWLCFSVVPGLLPFVLAIAMAWLFSKRIPRADDMFKHGELLLVDAAICLTAVGRLLPSPTPQPNTQPGSPSSAIALLIVFLLVVAVAFYGAVATDVGGAIAPAKVSEASIFGLVCSIIICGVLELPEP